MVAYDELRSAQSSLWFAGNADWSGIADVMNDASNGLHVGTAKPLASGDWWTGVVAELAASVTTDVVDDIRSASAEMSAIADVLLGVATSIQLAQQTLAAAEDYAREHHLAVVDGLVVGPANSTAEQARQVTEAQELFAEALREATEADNAAAAALRKLAQETGITGAGDSDQQKDTGAFAVLNAASAEELTMIQQAIPTGPPSLVASWWAGLSSAEQQRLMLAVPATLGTLAGIPTAVKSELAGTSGVNKVALVEYALKNWNNNADDIHGDNCANFTSEALNAAGLNQVDLLSDRKDPKNWFGSTLGIERMTDGYMAFLSRSHSWTGAENLHDFLVNNGSQQVSLSQVKPGDLLFWRSNGNIHHVTVVTAVVDGHLYYTQHTPDQVNSDLTGRQPLDVDNEGPQQVIAVRVGQDNPW